eukprot:SAG22_NODE_1894_length_3366_cov_4.054178_2_plen_498_part_00
MGKKKKAPRPAGRAPAEKKDNPFERRVERKKHTALDPRARSKSVNLAESRGRAEEIRQQTLLVEYGQSNKANSFVDRRFGESDPTMTEDDKMLMRFQKEKQRQLRKGRNDFALEDDEELTHFGQSLGDNATLDWSDNDDSDADNRLDEELGRKYNFGGGGAGDDGAAAEDGSEVTKTKKEIMEEIIKKSKTYKAERRKDKEEADNLVLELDEDFKEIQGLLKSRFDPAGEDAETPAEATEEEAATKLANDTDAVEYNKLKNILGMDLRARATDRLKTEEELAREEREKLDRLEAARLSRMRDNDQDGSAQKVRRTAHRTPLARSLPPPLAIPHYHPSLPLSLLRRSIPTLMRSSAPVFCVAHCHTNRPARPERELAMNWTVMMNLSLEMTSLLCNMTARAKWCSNRRQLASLMMRVKMAGTEMALALGGVAAPFVQASERSQRLGWNKGAKAQLREQQVRHQHRGQEQRQLPPCPPQTKQPCRSSSTARRQSIHTRP